MATSSNRRDFIKAAGVASAAGLVPAVHAAGNDFIKVGLIGCGGRGTGAAQDCLRADKSVKLFAVGDVFEGQAKNAAKTFTGKKEFPEQVDIGDRVYSGLDAYKQVLAAGVDMVILATPPGFRPPHLEAAIAAGKHIFCEKPVAVDGPGIRKVLELAEEAKKKGLAVVAGTQRRHQAGYIETVKRIHDGAIGDVVSLRCAWNQGNIWFRDPKPGQTGAQYQIYNWYHFGWVCGDHIVEQHIHNIDVCNWVMKGHPTKCVGYGARHDDRPSRPAGDAKKAGNIFDTFACEFEYKTGQKMFSYCRQIDGTDSDVSETVYGSKGTSRVNAYMIGKEKVYDADPISPYVQEHIDLVNSIKIGKPLNELKQVAESTMTAILGRMACYTGKTLTWEQGLNSKTVLMPEGLTLESDPDVLPTAVPGKTKLI